MYPHYLLFEGLEHYFSEVLVAKFESQYDQTWTAPTPTKPTPSKYMQAIRVNLHSNTKTRGFQLFVNHIDDDQILQSVFINSTVTLPAMQDLTSLHAGNYSLNVVYLDNYKMNYDNRPMNLVIHSIVYTNAAPVR